METLSPDRPSQWPHRLAVALALVTFPLIWVGGLVTTYDAGMAVPDWPGTYGYNLFLYPWQTWLAAPWDVFIEHGHRLLGAAAGLLVIALVGVVLLTDRRCWLINAAFVALLLVILQGVLGGVRVLFDERLIALLHGCVSPLFFAYLAALVVVTSRWWQENSGWLGSSAASPRPTGVELRSTPATRGLVSAAWTTAGMAYLQLVLGAVVRHVPLSASPQVFRAALLLHLVLAAALTIQIGITAWQVWSARSASGLFAPATWLPALLAVQVLLGLATYVAKYSWPDWLGDYQFAAAYVVQERSLGQALVTTGHVAGGSLIVFVSVVLAMRSLRLVGWAKAAAADGPPSNLVARSAIGGLRELVPPYTLTPDP
jgi:cytochrome c oxidase assembly protein subunit 15